MDPCPIAHVLNLPDISHIRCWHDRFLQTDATMR